MSEMMSLMPKKGVVAHHDLQSQRIGQVHLIYRGKQVSPPPGIREIEIECEVYSVDGFLSVHTVCPKCRHTQWIDGRNKKVEFDANKNELYVEPFECPWEMSVERREFGIGLCRLKLAYDGKIARDA